MGGGKSSTTGSISNSKTNTSMKKTYGNTSTSNPYVTSNTTNKGTVTDFTKGSGAELLLQFCYPIKLHYSQTSNLKKRHYSPYDLTGL